MLAPTSPGIEIKVTPDNEAPIIPNATIYHGDLLFPRKNVKLPEVLLVSLDITSRVKK